MDSALAAFAAPRSDYGEKKGAAASRAFFMMVAHGARFLQKGRNARAPGALQ